MSDTAKAAYVEPLKLTDQEHARLVANCHRADERRSHTRHPAPPGFRVLVRFDTGSAASLAVLVPVSDMSAGGIGLLHSSYICPGARCVVSMLSVDREAIAVRGQVTHCEFIAGRTHIVGVMFDSPVEPADFIPVTPDKVKAPPPPPASPSDPANTPSDPGAIDADAPDTSISTSTNTSTDTNTDASADTDPAINP